MGMKLLFSCDNGKLVVGRDLRGRLGFKSTEYCTRVGGGNGDCQHSASDEVTGKSEYRRV